MRIKVADLRDVTNLLLAHLEESGQDEVELPHDYYWDVPKDSRYDPYAKPEDLDLGQLADDWSELQRIHEGQAEPIAYGLVWLASVLRAVGERVVQ